MTRADVTREGILAWSGAGLAVLLLIVDVLDVVANSATLRGQLGVDYRLYMDAATRWLNGGPFVNPYQLAGPYSISAGDILYPPVALILFVPFTFLPAVLWWALPATAIARCLYRLRPNQLAWLWIAVCALWPTTPLKTLTGNPVIWAVAAMALGVLYYWPSVLVLIKPSLFPFAFFGSNRRTWWFALGLFALACVPFGSLWIDWIHSVLNSQGGGLAYSALEIPMLALPVMAWLGRTDRKQSEIH